MRDVASLFERLVAAHQRDAFWEAFVASDLSSAPVYLHPLGFRVAIVSGNGRLSLRLHVWPSAAAEGQSGYNIHDHVFDMTSHVLVGALRQTRYDVSAGRPATHATYGVGYDDEGSFLAKTQETVRAAPKEFSDVPIGSTYSLRAGEFHMLERASSLGAATLVLTRSGDGSPRTLGPLDGADAIRFRRERLPHNAMQELAPILAAAALEP